MQIRLFHLAGLAAIPALLGACAGHPPEVGPPPMPHGESAVVSDSSGEPVAPALPDPAMGLSTNAGGSSAASDGLSEDVWSVQVFAAVDENRARDVARQVRAATTEQVEVLVESDNMWRVYAGRANGRESIDRLRDQLRGAGWNEAWTKRRTVRNTASDMTLTPGTVVYSVQVFASSSTENAERTAERVRGATSLPVEVVQVGDYTKVFVGKSPTRPSIDTERDRLRRNGFPDAWTYERQGE